MTIEGEELRTDDRNKEKERLTNELQQMRQRVAKLEALEAERERLEQALTDTLTYAQGIVQTLREPLLVLDANLRVRTANPSFYRTFKVSPEQTENMSIYELGNGQWDIPKLRTLLRKILTEDYSIEDFEVEHEFPLIGYRVMLLNARRIYQEGVGTQLILLAIGDITEHRRTEEFREHYIHMISHDLRGPLTIVQGQAQLLQRELAQAGLKDGARRSLDAIIISARRMDVMIEDLVDSTRMEAGQLQLETQPVDLLTFMSNLLRRAGPIMDVGRIKFEIPAGLPPISADPDRLERIMLNLLSNALKYSPPEAEVLVKAEKTNGEVTILVIDQGIGIAPEDLPHMFERYYRAEGARQTEGLGLGLYISRMLVEAHGGRIWVESELEKGSTFHFTMPLP